MVPPTQRYVGARVMSSGKPGRVITGAFALAIAAGTGLLMLPAANVSGDVTHWVDALFTATSAICVTGLATVDTEHHWTDFGRAVILVLIQLGGLGIMTVATFIAAFFSKNLGLQTQLTARAERNAVRSTDVRRLLGAVVGFSLAMEALAAIVLTLRFALFYRQPLGEAIWSGVFHAISAFNNAGFGLFSDNLVRYAGDGWVLMTVSLAVIIGGLGFPVVFEIARNWRRPRMFSVVTKITLPMTLALLVLGTIAFMVFEGRNPDTLGAWKGGQFVALAFFTSVMPRTAGFNAIDIGAMHQESLLLSDVFMFIGGGSAGTAGGIKVTTFGLLAFVLWAEMRGKSDVEVDRRRIEVANQRQAVAIALLGVALVMAGTMLLLVITRASLSAVLFEAASAFGTAGLSTGITPTLPDSAKLVLVGLMFTGRLGPLTLASALAMRERVSGRRLPEERMTLG